MSDKELWLTRERLTRELVCQGGHELNIVLYVNGLDVLDVSVRVASLEVFLPCEHCQKLTDMCDSYAKAMSEVLARYR